MNLSLLPLLIYGACRRYLQAIGFVAPVTFALVSANLVNAFGNWMLIYGHFGFPAMGTDGAALATVVSRAYMAGVVIAGVIWYDYRHRGTLWHVSRRIELGVAAPAARARRPRRDATAARGRRVRVGDAARGQTHAGRVRRAPDLAEHHQLRCSWCRSASPPPAPSWSAAPSAATIHAARGAPAG